MALSAHVCIDKQEAFGLYLYSVLPIFNMKPTPSSKLFVSALSVLFIAGCFTVSSENPTFAKGKSSTKAKAKKKKTKSKSRTSAKPRLVPPPPPYAPSILPELAYGRKSSVNTSEEEDDDKPKNPYAKYIYHRDQAKIPTPVKPNKYVTYWDKTQR